jgi:hypothetical protein
MDATRADSTPVVLKVVRPSSSEYEMFITAAWAPRTAGAHPHNHNTPIHEVLQMPSDPTTFLLVLPKLRKYANVPFETIGEAVAFFQQMFEVRGCVSALRYSDFLLLGPFISARQWCSASVSYAAGILRVADC